MLLKSSTKLTETDPLHLPTLKMNSSIPCAALRTFTCDCDDIWPQ